MLTICLVLATAVLVLSVLLYVLQAGHEEITDELRALLADERAKHVPPTVSIQGRLQVGPPIDPAALVAREVTGRP